MAAHQQIKVSGHLQDKRGIYQMALDWYVDGKRHRKSISTGLPIKGNKKKAEAMLRDTCSEWEQRLSEQALSASSGIWFADLLEQWIEAAKHDYKPTTYGNAQNNIKSIIAPYFREKKLLTNEVTAEHIYEFYRSEMERGLKPGSIHKYHSHLSKAFQYAIKPRMLIETSPMKDVKRPSIPRYAAKFLRQSETVDLFEAIKGHKLELGVIMAAYYGLRRGEIVGLRWESIDFEKNTITIEHTVTVAHKDGHKVIIEDDTTKTQAGLRTLPLVPEFKAVLMALKEKQDANRKLCGNSYNKKEGQYIYVDLLGNRIRPDYLTAEFPKWMEKNGFRRIRFHDLRHSCASLLLANGVPLKQIQEWLGHSSFKITADAYAHLEYESKIAAASAMTWVKETSLAQDDPEDSVEAPPQLTNESQAAFLEAVQSALASNIPIEAVQAGLKQIDLTTDKSLQEQFAVFMLSSIGRALGKENCQPIQV